MVKKTKGQVATEYMSTFIWTGIALVVTVGALSYFGAFDADLYVKEGCQTGEQLSCAEIALYDSGVVMINLRNNLPRDIRLTQITITDVGTFPLTNVVNDSESTAIIINTSNNYSTGNKEELSFELSYRRHNDPGARVYRVQGSAITEVSSETIIPTPSPVCGNGVIESGEECDLTDLGGAVCPYGGTPVCNSCALDHSFCLPAPAPGDDNAMCFECNSGSLDCDQTSSECDSLNLEGRGCPGLTVGYLESPSQFKSGHPNCCGDDGDEFFTPIDCGEFGWCDYIKMFPTNTHNACCTETNNCAYEGTCYADSDELVVYDNLAQEYTISCALGIWELA